MCGKRELEGAQSACPASVSGKQQKNNESSWYEENRDAIDALNKFVEENGTFSDFQRAF
ncbi:type II toxin-antitoxin system CcdA family antitoxin [Buttiauxella izardii]|uniref:Plasmid maintenance protein CcdB n=1 Tax=Buttiauxella izardii TaxID=82991 RepID=A0A3A5JNN6_9ENTR|nr:type II toxin-antitoxin system CcdA family antitoxin [Buttiauxella izardii]RJT19667.1 hypothetical protein D6029_17925 [Buttiauxella izardii]